MYLREREELPSPLLFANYNANYPENRTIIGPVVYLILLVIKKNRNTKVQSLFVAFRILEALLSELCHSYFKERLNCK